MKKSVLQILKLYSSIKKEYIGITLILFLIFTLLGCSNYTLNTSGSYIMSQLRFDLSMCDVKKVNTTYTRNSNTGEYYLFADCKKKDDTYEYFDAWNKLPLSSKINDWKKLPMSDNLESYLFDTNGIFERENISRIRDGYYYFLNRDPNAIDSGDESFEDMANYTIAIFDNSTKMFYMCSYDS